MKTRVQYLGFLCLITTNFLFAQCKIIYVTPQARTGGDGTKSSPKTIYEAFSSVQEGEIIRLADGNYLLDSALKLQSKKNIIIEGGFLSSLNWKKTSSVGTTTLVRSTKNPEGLPNTTRLVALYIANSDSVLLQDLSIKTQNATLPGQSCYGIHVNNSSAYQLNRMEVKAGNAQNGKSGEIVADGKSGMDGENGKKGNPDNKSNTIGLGGKGGNAGSSSATILGGNGASMPNNPGGNGGNSNSNRSGSGGGGGGAGGQNNFNGTKAGSSGTNILGINSANTVSGGINGNPGKNGTNGIDGKNGTKGVDGTNGTFHTFSTFFEVGTQGSNGTDGIGGQGGTGGAGGGGQKCTLGCVEGTGHGGAGGGGGGEGGAGGNAGTSGGGSFGIYVVNNGPRAMILSSKIEAGNYGLAGIGSEGGKGGMGGKGGKGDSTDLAEIGRGGNGGNGGNGGDGGKGGNGVDGFAQNVYQLNGFPIIPLNSTEPLSANTVVLSNEITQLNETVILEAINSSNPTWKFGPLASIGSSNTNPTEVSFSAGFKHSFELTEGSNSLLFKDFLCHCPKQIITATENNNTSTIWHTNSDQSLMISGLDKSASELYIYDSKGQLIKKVSHAETSQSTALNHDISDLQQGLYLFSLYNPNKKLFSGKFIK
jgi:hypothetical protein